MNDVNTNLEGHIACPKRLSLLSLSRQNLPAGIHFYPFSVPMALLSPRHALVPGLPLDLVFFFTTRFPAPPPPPLSLCVSIYLTIHLGLPSHPSGRRQTDAGSPEKPLSRRIFVVSSHGPHPDRKAQPHLPARWLPRRRLQARRRPLVLRSISPGDMPSVSECPAGVRRFAPTGRMTFRTCRWPASAPRRLLHTNKNSYIS